MPPDTTSTRGIAAVATGTVKWFNSEKGYGFIQQESGPDIFVHHTSIEMSGYRTLEEGQEVEFEFAEGEKGLCASAVRPSGVGAEVSADRSDASTAASAPASTQSSDAGDTNAEAAAPSSTEHTMAAGSVAPLPTA